MIVYNVLIKINKSHTYFIIYFLFCDSRYSFKSLFVFLRDGQEEQVGFSPLILGKTNEKKIIANTIPAVRIRITISIKLIIIQSSFLPLR